MTATSTNYGILYMTEIPLEIARQKFSLLREKVSELAALIASPGPFGGDKIVVIAKRIADETSEIGLPFLVSAHMRKDANYLTMMLGDPYTSSHEVSRAVLALSGEWLVVNATTIPIINDHLQRSMRWLIERIDRFPSQADPPSDHVTLRQCAPLVNKQKRTLERWKTKDTSFPTPEVIGGDGKADEWLWTTIRPYLERKSDRKLPDEFPRFNPR